MYALFLYDTSLHDDIYTQNSLINYLNEIQFLEKHNNGHLPAQNFMNHITFLGCSPALQIDIKNKINTVVKQHVSAYGGNSIEKVICPECKTKIHAPNQLILNASNSSYWNSSCCQKKINIKNINWRKSAAFSQAFIQIDNIFPKEAIPSDQLLQLLSHFSHTNWNYFYSKQQSF